MAKYRECPNCSVVGDYTVWKCSECEEKFCDDCKGDDDLGEVVADAMGALVTFGVSMYKSRLTCPHCDHHGYHEEKGTIIDDGDEDDDD